MRKLLFVIAAFTFAVAAQANASIIPFDLIDKAGPGLLSGNETEVILGNPPGSGGKLGPGITFDNVTNVLAIDVGWGSGNGFANLTGNATVGHIHGPTTDPAPLSFNETADVKYPLHPLPGWDPSATNGGVPGHGQYLPADVPGLLAGRSTSTSTRRSIRRARSGASSCRSPSPRLSRSWAWA